MIKSISKNRCIGCGQCVEVCPMDILRIDEKNNKVCIAYCNECQTCYQCKIVCPTDAITVLPNRRKIMLPIIKMEGDKNGNL